MEKILQGEALNKKQVKSVSACQVYVVLAVAAQPPVASEIYIDIDVLRPLNREGSYQLG